jgi:hypothetical protein
MVLLGSVAPSEPTPAEIAIERSIGANAKRTCDAARELLRKHEIPGGVSIRRSPDSARHRDVVVRLRNGGDFQRLAQVWSESLNADPDHIRLVARFR